MLRYSIDSGLGVEKLIYVLSLKYSKKERSRNGYLTTCSLTQYHHLLVLTLVNLFCR